MTTSLRRQKKLFGASYNESKLTFTQRQRIKFINGRSLDNFEDMGFYQISDKIEFEWLERICLCDKFEITEQVDNNTLFQSISKNFDKDEKDMKNASKYLEEKGFDMIIKERPLTKFVKFETTIFDMNKFLREDRKLNLMTKEIALWNIVTSVIQSLYLCRILKLPHGNISPQTVFKKGRMDWEISPPLFSSINLCKRIYRPNNNPNSSRNYAGSIEFCVAPELLAEVLAFFKGNYNFRFTTKFK